METLTKYPCWEIMQCADRGSCPVPNNGRMCWEWMALHDEFQCQYGLCEECIVYLYHNDNTILSGREAEEVLHHRLLGQTAL